MVTIIIFFIAHMLALYHAFGGTLRTFSTPFDALNTMFSLVLGEFDPREIEEANPDVGKTIFLLFMFFFFFLLCAAAICRIASSPARVPATKCCNVNTCTAAVYGYGRRHWIVCGPRACVPGTKCCKYHTQARVPAPK